ncbi:hypothetical protein BJY04DRAFT_194929, partial [Aspergillus karnatakaensis]|uniref:uncharacterized protein n=1 Tax=Aspergillus karnatakaensis TaxID=1810916 RepID=UPI003CCE2580
MTSFSPAISSNRKPGKELSKETRSAILHALWAGESPTKIAAQFRVSRRVVYNTKERWNTHQTVKSLPRTGRPSVISQSGLRYLYQRIRRTPKL